MSVAGALTGAEAGAAAGVGTCFPEIPVAAGAMAMSGAATDPAGVMVAATTGFSAVSALGGATQAIIGRTSRQVIRARMSARLGRAVAQGHGAIEHRGHGVV